MKNKFRNKNGALSIYAFACGYIQEAEHNGARVELFKDGCWHVKTHGEDGSKNWECFDTLTPARKFFNAEVRGMRAS